MPPDVRAQLDGRAIAIEHTRLFAQSAKKLQSELKKIQRALRDAIESDERLYGKLDGRVFIVQIDYSEPVFDGRSEKRPAPSYTERKLVAELVEFVRTTDFSNLYQFEFYTAGATYPCLSSLAATALIDVAPKRHIFVRMGGRFIYPNLDIQRVQERIAKK